MPPASNSRVLMISELRSGLRRFQHGLRTEAFREDVAREQIVSTGIEVLDNLLPDKGLRRGTLSEWIGSEPGSGALSLAIRAAAKCQAAGLLLVIDPEKTLYPPAIQAAGIDLAEVVFIHPPSRSDALWAVEQSLRCSGPGCVLFPVDQLQTREFRRLQLAAEKGTAVGILVRPPQSRRQPGWADVRLLVSPRPSPLNRFCRRMSVQCIYARGKQTEQRIELEICDETGVERLAAGLSAADTVQ